MEKTRWKLDTEVKQTLISLLGKHHERDLAYYFGLHRTTIIWYMRKYGIRISKNADLPVLTHEYQQYLNSKQIRPKNYLLYKKELVEKLNQQRSHCLHERWLTKCSCCGKLLMSDNGVVDSIKQGYNIKNI